MTEYSFTHSSFRGMCGSHLLLCCYQRLGPMLCLNARREDLTQVHKYCLNLGHTNNTQFKHSHFCSFKMFFFLAYFAMC